MTWAQGKLTPQARQQLLRQKAKTERLAAAARTAGKVITAQEQQRMTLIVNVAKGEMAATAEQMKAVGAEVRSRLGRQVVVSVPIDSIEALQRIEGVQRIDKGHKGQLKSDVTRQETGVSKLNGPTASLSPEEATAFTGKGVTICLIDIGFDFQHPAFKDAEGRSRIKCVYMMNKEDGHKFTVSDPDLGDYTFPGTVYDTPELIATLTTDTEDEYHGTHTAGIAAGSLSPQGFGGMAPEADLVLIPMGGIEALDEETSEEYYMEQALAFAAAYADQSEQPVVLSASMNSHDGPHDGTSSMTEAIEATSEHLIPVFSTGNEGGYPIHLYQKFTAAKTSIKTLLMAMTEDETGQYSAISLPQVTGYVRQGDMVSLQLTLKSVNMMTGSLSTIWTSGKCTATPNCDDQLIRVSSEDDPTLAKHFEGEVMLGAFQDEKGRLCVTAAAEGGLKKLYFWELTVSGSKGTEIDLWDNLAGFGGVAFVGLPGYVDGDSDMSGGDWTSTDRAISVGAYCANVQSRSVDGSTTDTSKSDEDDQADTQGDIAWFSSYGTSFNGVVQPHICAPGVNVVSSVNHYAFEDMAYADAMQWEGYPYSAESGTSMSCPAVAGIVALWLQAKPDMTVDDVKDVLSHTSRTDAFTDADNKGRWGYGKIDAAAGISYLTSGAEAIHTVGFSSTPGNVVYDLQGRTVGHRPAAGLYIKNGRKVVIR